jgi:hypothetical protein
VSVDLARLASLAEAARTVEGLDDGWYSAAAMDYAIGGGLALAWAEAEFIEAVSPAVVLALVGRVRLLEAVAEAADDLVRFDRGLVFTAKLPPAQVEMHVTVEAHSRLSEALAALDVDPPPRDVRTPIAWIRGNPIYE